MPDPIPSSLHQLRFDDAERGFVYAVGRRYVHDADAAEDIAQEAMTLAFRHRDSFRGDSHPRSWLYRIAATTALSYLRRQRRSAGRMTGCDPDELARLPDLDARSADDALADHERADELARQLGALDDKYASVMRLRAEDLREHEIAERLGISVAAVKIRAHRARAMLRAAMVANPAQRATGSSPAQKSDSSRMLAQHAA